MKIGEPIGQNKRHGFNVFARFAYTSARMRKRTFLFHAHMANGDWGTCVYSVHMQVEEERRTHV